MKLKKKGIIAVLAIAMTSAIASMATGCKLVDNIKNKIEQWKCEHTTEVVTEIEPATCTENGLTEGVKCGDCDKWIVEPDEIPALGHEEVKDEAVPVGCLTSGLTEGSHCARCEETIKKQETVKATGHKLVAIEGYEPTCWADGLTDGAACTTCETVYTAQETIPCDGHNFVDSVCTLCALDKTDNLTLLNVGDSVAGQTVSRKMGDLTEDEKSLMIELYEKFSSNIPQNYPLSYNIKVQVGDVVYGSCSSYVQFFPKNDVNDNDYMRFTAVLFYGENKQNMWEVSVSIYKTDDGYEFDSSCRATTFDPYTFIEGAIITESGVKPDCDYPAECAELNEMLFPLLFTLTVA